MLVITSRSKTMKNQKGFATIALVIVIVVIAGVAGYFVVRKSGPVAQQTPTVSASPTQTKSPTPTPKNETASWKTYSNSRASFEVGYPSNFSAQRSTAKSGGETVQFSSGKYDVAEIIINVEGGNLSDVYSSLNNALEGMRGVNKFSSHINKEVGTVTVANVVGYKFKTVDPKNPSYIVKEDIVFEKGGLIYFMSFQNPFLSQEAQLLSTFKFTK